MLPCLLICLFLFHLLGSWPAAWQWSDCAGSWEQAIQEVMIVEPLSALQSTDQMHMFTDLFIII